MGLFSGFGASKRGKEKGLKQVQAGPTASLAVANQSSLDSELSIPLHAKELSFKNASNEKVKGQNAVGNVETPRAISLEEETNDAVDGSQTVQYQEFTLPSPEVCQIRTMTQNMSQRARVGYERVAGKMPELGCTLVELFENFKAFEESAMICHGQHENMSELVEFLTQCLEEYGSTDPITRPSNTGEESIYAEVETIISNLQNFTAIAASYSQPGWVYRLCIDIGLHGSLVNGASALAKSFEVMGLTSVNTPLLQNMHKLVVTELKLIGSGSWTAGLRGIREDPAALVKLAKTLRSSESVLIRESCLNLSLPWAVEPIGSIGTRGEECKTVFLEYCRADGSSLLSAEGFQRYIIDSHHLSKFDDDDKMIQASTKLFVEIDKDFDGFLSAEEFQTFYLQKKVAAVRSLVRLVTSISVERSMRNTFEAFAAFGASGRSSKHSHVLRKHFLDGFRFSKLCKDSNIVSRRENQKEDADIAFSKCVPANSKKMDFDHFLVAITRLSVAVRLSLSEVYKRVATCPGPSSTCTKASYVKLHDDKTLFTGVYARGGPDIGPTVVHMETHVSRKEEQQPARKTEQSMQITLPESPKMATTSRIASPGPKTPGRGASLEASEARKAREAQREHGESLKQPNVAFGRSGSAVSPEAKKKSPGSTTTVSIAASTRYGHA